MADINEYDLRYFKCEPAAYKGCKNHGRIADAGALQGGDPGCPAGDISRDQAFCIKLDTYAVRGRNARSIGRTRLSDLIFATGVPADKDVCGDHPDRTTRSAVYMDSGET